MVRYRLFYSNGVQIRGLSWAAVLQTIRWRHTLSRKDGSGIYIIKVEEWTWRSQALN